MIAKVSALCGRTGLLVMAVAGASAYALGYAIDWYTVDGGGETLSVGGAYGSSGTIGQPDAGPVVLSGGSFTLTGGFWGVGGCNGLVGPDFDHDCDVDNADYQAFEACASGPAIHLAAGCEAKDLDGDNDVDQVDFAILQRCLSGPDRPADPRCAD